MQLQKVEFVLWACGFALSALLFGLLLWNRRRSELWFTIWIGFGCLNTIILFIISRVQVPHLYFWCYWAFAFVDLVLQLCVIYEVGRAVLKRGKQWISHADLRLKKCFLYSLPVAMIVATVLKPAVDSVVDSIFARANLFMTLLFCFVLGSVVRVSAELGIRWRGRSAKLAYGLVLWNLISFVADTLHTYWTTANYFGNLEYIRDAAFLTVVTYWIWISARGTADDWTAETTSVPRIQYRRTA